MQPVGVGNPNANLIVYIANKPPLDEFTEMSEIRPVRKGEIKQIGELTGNHWRKIFNCYAKLAFELNKQDETSWQNLRDNQLLTNSSSQLLLFSSPDLFENSYHEKQIRLISGKSYFNQLSRDFSVEWIDDYFAVNHDNKVIICPYFDYRQLSNIKIIQLVGLINLMIK